MELQELINTWNDYDKKLESNLKVNKQLLRQVSFSKVRSLLTEFKASQIIELVFNALFAIFLINFMIDFFSSPKFFFPALGLFVLMAWGLVWNIYALTQILTTDYRTPVIEAQRRLEKLRLYQIRERNLLYVLIPLFWMAFLIVFLKGFLNLDFYLIFKGWFISSIAGSIVVAIIVVWFLKKFPDKNMEKAVNFLEEIKALEKEN